MKRLAICCDGTWSSEDVFVPTNVRKIYDAVSGRGSDGIPQLRYYVPGVGVGNRVTKLLGGTIGRGLLDTLVAGYRFLCQNYKPGDEIYLFGFSRGAYTARSLAGMIRACGILRSPTDAQIEQAVAIYRGPTVADSPAALTFRANCSHPDTRIRFIGVWDTVGRLGIPGELRVPWQRDHYQFHDLRLSRRVEYAYHALAIDERRRSFGPTLWRRRPPNVQHDPLEHPATVCEQRWFVGSHSDVGGGQSHRGLSDLPLAWIRGRAEALGLRFRPPRPVLTPFHYRDEIHRPRRLQRALRGARRTIGRFASESLAPSVVERVLDPQSSYRPRNLISSPLWPPRGSTVTD